ncbi:MAG TPA: sigma 54-interacting transcriptional regulator [Gemmataceae bacterium]|nr:sigma 54-interacting transcriptional regulator [Gemmataceae bacterium]
MSDPTMNPNSTGSPPEPPALSPRLRLYGESEPAAEAAPPPALSLGDWPVIVTRSPAMLHLVEQAQRIARSKAAVLIEGESGTGKELIARLIHAASPRADKPLVAVNCAALSESLIESELFGHEKGAFTGAEDSRPGRFELADGSTLLLDEISEIPVRLQAKLLRLLEEEAFERVGGRQSLRVDVRIVATTNRHLSEELARGNMRRDLYYRLAVVSLCLPPLRERREDVMPLAEHFLACYRQEGATPLHGITSAALKLLTAHHWPGNVRELRNVLHRACLLASGSMLTPADLPPFEEPVNGPGGLPGTSLAEVERHLILKTLRELNGNRTATARRLGVTTRTLLNKLNRYSRQGLV